jgi:hypothetical protein
MLCCPTPGAFPEPAGRGFNTLPDLLVLLHHFQRRIEGSRRECGRVLEREQAPGHFQTSIRESRWTINNS